MTTELKLDYVADYPDPFDVSVKSSELAETFCITVKSPFHIILGSKMVTVDAGATTSDFFFNQGPINIGLPLKVKVPYGYGFLNCGVGMAHRDYLIDTMLDHYSVCFRPLPNAHILIKKGDPLLRIYPIKNENVIFKYNEFSKETL